MSVCDATTHTHCLYFYFFQQSKFVWTNFIAVFVALVACLILNNKLPTTLDFKKVEKRTNLSLQ